LGIALLLNTGSAPALEKAPASPWPEGWTARSPREEIRPAFAWEQNGAEPAGRFVIRHDQREGLDGWFERTVPVTGGDWYSFSVRRRLENVPLPRRSALVRLVWHDDAGRLVPAGVPTEQVRELGHTPSAEPEHPVDGPADAAGWATVKGLYQAPPKATAARIELHLQWAPGGRVDWSVPSFEKTSPPAPRIVRLAAVHHKPKAGSPRENCEEFAPLVAEAVAKKADLVVLGETVPSVNAKLAPHELAEPIPGPTTKYFCELSRAHKTHIVLSLYERNGHLVHNTAVLTGPDGQLIGKYRKVCLPHGEVEKGIAPGSEYPVFETRFGKVGLMVCYDGFFPEVARELSNRGAEVIAWPVWGCNPLLARARAAENHVHVVSSTFMAPKDGWMLSAVFDQTGRTVAVAEQWGTVVVAEVDLNRPYVGPWNLGDFHSMIPRHRPLTTDESRVDSQSGSR
jgi:predicted amidohydrolase